MSSLTERLQLLMKDPLTDGHETFNIETMLNDNWRIIDALVALKTEVISGTDVDQKINAAIANLISGSPAALDTLNELAAALNDDPNFAATVLNRLTQAEQALTDHASGTNADAHKIANITGLQTALTDAKSQIDVVDTRSTNEPPSFYYAQGSKVQAEFKGLAVLNLIASGVNYAVLVTNCPWNDSSGGPVTQYALIGSEIYVRRSTSPTTWGMWSSDGISYRKYLSGKDSEGIYTIVEKRRKHDGSLAERSVLSGGTAPLYTTRTITEYGPDGIAALKTETFALSYDSDGVLISEV